MSPDYYLCDVCKKPTKHRFFFCTGSTFDGAGNSADGESIDLCDVDMARALRSLTDKNSATAEVVIDIVERIKKPRT